MDARQNDELRSLRERAYGPRADIHKDPAAVARLQQLERGDVSPLEDPLAPDEPAATAPIEAPGPVAVEQKKQRARPRLRELGILVGSLGVAVAATAVITNATVHAAHSDPQNVGATQVASLSEDAFWTIPSFFAGIPSEATHGYEEFYGLRVVVGNGPWALGPNDVCIFVMASADADAATDDSFGGQIHEACAANSFPAAVAFKVSDDMPESLRQEFPNGTALQFVFDEAGSDVVVFRADAE